MPKSTYIIAGDIGGTNSRFSIHIAGQRENLFMHIYANENALQGAPNFHHATLKPFLELCHAEIDEWKIMEMDVLQSQIQIVVCLATAGPVKSNNTVFMCNMGSEGQSIDGNEIERCQDGLLSLVIRCKLVNDFVGQGYGILDLNLTNECVELIPGSIARIDDMGPKACVGAGTGLGECFLTKSTLRPDLGYECYPSEGGHVDFVPRGQLEIKLVEYLKEKFDSDNRISVERVVSGRGLANVYEFLAQYFPEKVDMDVHDQFLNAGDQQGRVIGENAKNEGSLTALAAQIMITAYGSEVGNTCLKFLPTGGMFVTGGLTPKNIDFIRGNDSPFMKAYIDKGRMSPLLKTIPLLAVMTEDVGLRGARVCAERELNVLEPN